MSSFVDNAGIKDFLRTLLTEDKNNKEELLHKIQEVIDSGVGEPGVDGKSLEFNWDGTRLGVRKEGETSYSYVDLKGQDGSQGPQGPAGDTPTEDDIFSSFQSAVNSGKIDLNNKNRIYQTVSDMKSDNKLTDGAIAITSGYYAPGDGGGAKYIITTSQDVSSHFEPLDNGLYARLIIEGESIYPRQWGAHFNGYFKGDDNKFYKDSAKTLLADDDTDVIKEIIDKMNKKADPKPVSILIDGACILSESLNVVSSISFRGTSIGILDRPSRRGSIATNLDSLDSFMHHEISTSDGSDLHSFVVEDIEFIGYRTKYAIDFTGFGEVSEINRCKFEDFTEAAIHSTKGGTLTTLNHCSLFRNKVAVAIIGSSQWVINECGGDFNETFFQVGDSTNNLSPTVNLQINAFKCENNMYPMTLYCSPHSIIQYTNGRWDAASGNSKCLVKIMMADMSQSPTLLLMGLHSQSTPTIINIDEATLVERKSNGIAYFTFYETTVPDICYKGRKIMDGFVPSVLVSDEYQCPGHNSHDRIILTGDRASLVIVNTSPNKMYILSNVTDVEKKVQIEGVKYICRPRTTETFMRTKDNANIYTTMAVVSQ